MAAPATANASSSGDGVFAPPVPHLPPLDYESPPAPSTRQPAIPWLTDWIDRHRLLLFAVCGLIGLASFNGRWRVGLDSSLYRGLADSLAAGRGYHFGEFASHQIYPGLPYWLALMRKLEIFGDPVFRPIVSILSLNLMAVAIVAITYRLIRLHFPQWMAVCVACGVASNAHFVELANDLLTDIPFLLGVMLALYGWDRLRLAHDKKAGAIAIVLLAAGLLIAGTTRPTFWILACAMGVASLGGLIFTRRRGFHALCLATLVAAWAIVAMADPRFKGLNSLAGGYESELVTNLLGRVDADSRAAVLDGQRWVNLRQIFLDDIPWCFFGQEIPWKLGGILTAALLFGSLLFLPRQPLWTLVIWFTIPATTFLSTNSRYYVMLLPLLLITSLVLVNKLRARLTGGWGDLVLLAALGVVSGMNFAGNARYIFSQHRDDFYAHYRNGEVVRWQQLAELIRATLPPDARVVSPEAAIVRYLSGRNVLLEREVLPAKKSVRDHPAAVAESGVTYAVFPSRFYSEKNPQLTRLLDRGILRPIAELGQAGPMTLARVAIYLPKGPWRDEPRRNYFNKPTTAGQPFIPPRVATAARPPKRKPKPTTAAATAPTTRPAKKVKKPPLSPAQQRKRDKQKRAATTQASMSHEDVDRLALSFVRATLVTL